MENNKTTTEAFMPPKYHTSYKGIYYKYQPKTDTWDLADRPDGMGRRWIFNGCGNRIDQCFERVFADIKNNTTNGE